MSKELKRLLALGGLMAMSLGLCASRPPEVGHEVQGTVGGGQHALRPAFGCFGPRHVSQEGVIYAEYHYRSEGGFAFSAEGGVAIAEVEETSNEEVEPGDTRLSGMLALRIGYHGDFWGAEIGPAFYSGVVDISPLFVSSELWGGDPEVLYVYGEVMSDVVTEGEIHLGMGLGHASDRFQFQTGYYLNGFRADAALPVVGGWWLGAGFIASDSDNWDVLVRTRFSWGE